MDQPMNAHDIDIEWPPLPGSLYDLPGHYWSDIQAYVLAVIQHSIEADRQRRRESGERPSGAEIWQFTYDFNKGSFRDSDDVIDYARALLERYGQPAEPAKGSSEAEEALRKAYESLRELEKEIVLDVNQISGAAAASFAANRVLALLSRYGKEPK